MADVQAPATISCRVKDRHLPLAASGGSRRMLNETLILPLELKLRPNGIFQSLR
jgi:hypothetical protein